MWRNVFLVFKVNLLWPQPRYDWWVVRPIGLRVSCIRACCRVGAVARVSCWAKVAGNSLPKVTVGMEFSKAEVLYRLESGEVKAVHNDGTSGVWSFFQLLVDSNVGSSVGFVRCVVCGVLLRYNSHRTGTSSLSRHGCYVYSRRKCIHLYQSSTLSYLDWNGNVDLSANIPLFFFFKKKCPCQFLNHIVYFIWNGSFGLQEISLNLKKIRAQIRAFTSETIIYFICFFQ